MRVFLISITALALASCATDNNPGGSALQSFTIDQGPCFGYCPVYEMTISDGDRYILNARQNTRVDGISEGRLSPGAFAQIETALSQAGFRDLPEQLTFGNPEQVCPGPQVSDMPYFEFTAVYADATKTVQWYQGCYYGEVRAMLDAVYEAIEFETRIQRAR